MSSGDIESVTSSKKRRRRFPWQRRSILLRFGRCSERKDSAVDEVISTEGLEVSKNLTSNSTSKKEDTLTIQSEASTNAKYAAVISSDVASSSSMVECPLCLISQTADNFPQLTTCHHRSCLDCLRQYLAIEITESRVNLMCPECQERLHPNDMKIILENDPQLIVKWEEFTLRRTLSVDPDCRWCPAPDCGYAVIAQGCASCPKLVCERPGCSTSFCYHCRQEWHPDQTCDAAHLQRTRQIRVRNNSVTCSQADEIKPCPKCGALIVKMNDGSCNHMTCTVCDAEFCWLCLQEITDLHYLSPSGCTFWGKKPWSRKKKILWQLGLLIGAPLGIGLVAGVAVPAIIIGLPFWVARKALAQFKNLEVSKHRRNVVVASCVAGSVVISPALAALAVGIGVPVMLIYVYGVVPFSLCRTGSYGLTAGGDRSASSPLTAAQMDPLFRITDLNAPRTSSSGSGGGRAGGSGGAAANQEGDSSSLPGPSLNARSGPTNPSIGETSVGGMTMGSLSMSRGSQLDKVGRMVDHDGASTVAIAGTSITGSLSGISGTGTGNVQRLDIHGKDADQQSTVTQISTGSAATFTSVQMPACEEGEVPTTRSFSTSGVKKTYSSKSLGAKRKSKNAMKTGSCKLNNRSNTMDESSHTGKPHKVQVHSSTQRDVVKPSHPDTRSEAGTTSTSTQQQQQQQQQQQSTTSEDTGSCGSQQAFLLPSNPECLSIVTVL